MDVVLVVELELELELVLVVDDVELELELDELELLPLGVEVELVVVGGVELVKGVELVVEVELVKGVELVVDEVFVDVVVVVAGAQLIVSETNTPLIGSDRDEAGVPGGTLTAKVNRCPPSRVTETVHASAKAFGIAASPRTTTADVTAATSFRLPNTVVCLLLPSRAHECGAATKWRRRSEATDCLGGLQRRTV